jgi:EAL domain-containing protein (putative c-di-GMP-specific phosphodiesterase class I)
MGARDSGHRARARRSSNDELDERSSRVDRALRPGCLTMAFQPVVNLRSGVVTGAEALARFQLEPKRTPDVWFAEAWEIGRGVELELVAVRTALAALSAMPEGTYLAVNVAPLTLMAPDLVTLLSSYACDRIIVELTEHARVEDYGDITPAVERLRAIGVRLAIDDAGAGFASFQHILQLRPELIKLDRSLTRAVDTDPVRYALASALVTFASSLGASVCAEGIETEQELVALQRLGIMYGQGYFLGRPGPLPLGLPPRHLWLHDAAASSEGKIRSAEHASTHSEKLYPSEAPGPPAVRDPARLQALYATGLLDSEAELVFDRFTRVASTALRASVALISLVDDRRQFFKSAVGLPEPLASKRETPLSHSFCQHVVTTKEPVVIADAPKHPLVRDNLAVLELGVKAYAGVPLLTSDSHALGALCVIEPTPRAWTTHEIDVLREIAAAIMVEIERRSDGAIGASR